MRPSWDWHGGHCTGLRGESDSFGVRAEHRVGEKAGGASSWLKPEGMVWGSSLRELHLAWCPRRVLRHLVCATSPSRVRLSLEIRSEGAHSFI